MQLHGADEKLCEVHSRSFGCFGYALAYCAGSNVQAVNALAMYSRTVSKGEALDVLHANNVRFKVVDENFKPKLAMDEAERYIESRDASPLLILYNDHAISITAKTTDYVAQTGIHRYRINLMTEEVSADPLY
jgi:hypothetical protein